MLSDVNISSAILSRWSNFELIIFGHRQTQESGIEAAHCLKIGMFKKKYFSPWTKLIESILKSQQPYFMIFKVNCKHFQLCSSLYWQVTIWQNIDYFLNGPAYKIAKYSIFHWFLNNILLIKCLSYEILLPGDDLAPYRPFLGLELLYNGIFIITLQVLWENELRIFRK